MPRGSFFFAACAVCLSYIGNEKFIALARAGAVGARIFLTGFILNYSPTSSDLIFGEWMKDVP